VLFASLACHPPLAPDWLSSSILVAVYSLVTVLVN